MGIRVNKLREVIIHAKRPSLTWRHFDWKVRFFVLMATLFANNLIGAALVFFLLVAGDDL